MLPDGFEIITRKSREKRTRAHEFQVARVARFESNMAVSLVQRLQHSLHFPSIPE